ncbi:MAG: family 10 glycosylhydrolase [Verrucomicrobiia bacterium]
MKTYLLTLLLATSACFAESLQHRGIWLHPDQYKTPQLAEEWIGRISAAHLNTIYPLIWHRGGTAWFKSKLSPMAADVPEGFDPLGNLVKLAHARGIAVHAWFVNGSYGSPATNGLFTLHPDWQLQGEKGGDAWYDLGKPAVRNFQRDLMLECLKNYDVDGLHFDYIRYSGQVTCYCDHCQHEFAGKYGFRPMNRSEDRFPALLDFGANPLGKPTTAKVLATFDHGVPAITVNRLDAGEAVLVNWQAAGNSCLALDNFVKDTLEKFGATAKNTYQLNTTQTAAKYQPTGQEKARVWLKGLGFPAKLIDESALAKIPKGATVVLASQYLVGEETAKWLESFVRAGGHCLFVDGPVFAIKQESLQRVVGLRGTAAYFHDWKVISPAPDQDVLKAGPPVDVAKERQRMEKWVEYRTWTVTELVRAVYKGAKKIKPRAWVNAAVFYKKDSADKVCQDWYGWLREGCIDYVLPMAYTEKNEQLAQAFAEWRAADPQMERIIPGLSIYSRQEGKAAPRDLALVRSQLDMCRDNATHGNLFFSLAFLHDELIKMLSSGPYAEPAKPWYPKRRK